MIRENVKITKYNHKKTQKQIIVECVRTFLMSVLVAVIFTLSLALYARHEMIKNLYTKNTIPKLDAALALQIINSTDLWHDIDKKSYLMCLQIGNTYATAGDFKNAEMAYKFAISKSKPNVYTPYYKLICVLIEQDKFKEANEILRNIKDCNSKNLIKCKTRSYITIGDKYYSLGKFLSAAKSYENAKFYYDKFVKKDKVVEKSIINRILNSYIQVADLMVKNGMNSDAIRFLKKAEAYSPNNFDIKYKIGIVFSDLDPEEAVKYLEPLVDKIPQKIDYQVYCNALMKSANIADLDGRPTQAKYYRYKIHSLDMFAKRKIVYKNDVDINMYSAKVNKVLFTYPITVTFKFVNTSNIDITKLYADFVLKNEDKIKETVTLQIANKDKPLLINNSAGNNITVKFKNNAFTKNELKKYTIDIYLYKDKKFKTFVYKTLLPDKSF